MFGLNIVFVAQWDAMPRTQRGRREREMVLASLEEETVDA